MIVIFNVKISNLRFFTHQRPNLKSFCRTEIFKYSVASHSAFASLVTKYIFFVELDADLINKRDEVEKFISETIDSSKLHLVWKRNNTVADWISCAFLWNDIKDDVIWFAGNDDHIFFDYNLDVIKSSVEILNEDKNYFSAVYFSHWPEAIRMAHRYNASLHQSKDFVVFDWMNHDSIRMMTKKLFNHYWFELPLDLDCPNFYRTDELNFTDLGRFPIKTYVPTRELCRHFDGYSHVGGLFDYFPPLEIPQEFFSSSMTIKYGYEEIDNQVTNMNPRALHLKCTNPHTGHDIWTTKDRIPLFWKNRIKNFDQNPVVFQDCDEHYKKRIINSLKARVDCYFTMFNENYHPPEYWIAKHT